MKTAVIIGAGPAGLTAALEFLRRSDIRPSCSKPADAIGGISRTIRHNGNRMDIGGHRFFSKSDRVMHWWIDLMPVAVGRDDAGNHAIRYQSSSDRLDSAAHRQRADLVMLVRPRRAASTFCASSSTIPSPSRPHHPQARPPAHGQDRHQLPARHLFPRRNEKTLEDFLINRFGRELYLTFFKCYTEKVWGVPCNEISAEWGAQRIKGLSLTTAVKHFLKKTFSRKKSGDIAQKGTETSLIEQFLYPKFGPGQLWEHVADLSPAKRRRDPHRLARRQAPRRRRSHRLRRTPPTPTAPRHTFAADYVFSTMPVRELIHALDAPVPADVREVADGLLYRDFITVGLLANRLTVKEPDGGPLKDTWIYIQEPDVLVGRLQIFNNWSPYMVADPSKVWIGLEYFCYDTDDLWKMPDDELERFAIAEVEKIGILHAADVLDAHVVRVPKTYPAYFGTYDRFDEITATSTASKTSSCRPQRHAQIQQPGPLHAHRHDRRRRHRRRPHRQSYPLGDQHRAGIPRREKIGITGYGLRVSVQSFFSIAVSILPTSQERESTVAISFGVTKPSSRARMSWVCSSKFEAWAMPRKWRYCSRVRRP